MSSRSLAAPRFATAFRPWLEWRDRLLTSSRFRRLAIAFPFTRPIARRRAKALFDLCAGFVYSQILLACVRLRVFPILAEGPQTLPELSARLGLSEEATRILLDAAASLQLVQPRAHATYGLGNLGAALVGNPGLTAMIEHHALLYADLADPVAFLQRKNDDTRLNRFWAYAATDNPGALQSDHVGDYSALMSASQTMIAEEILAVGPIAQHKCLLDIGGGDGTFLTTVAAQIPHLQMMLFDLPAVAEKARQRFSAAELNARAQAFGGDFLTDPLPIGADIVSIVRVIHDHDDAAALSILRAARSALATGGTLLVAEPMSGSAGVETVTDAYFAFYLLAMGRGRPRDFVALSNLLHKAGFKEVRAVATHMPMLTQLVLATAADG